MGFSPPSLSSLAMFSNTRLSLNTTLFALLLFIVLVVGLAQLSNATLEGLAVGNSFTQQAIGGSSFLQVSNAIIPGNNSLINYSNGIYENIGSNATFTFTLGILYNCNCTGGGIVSLVKNGAIGLISLGSGNGLALTMSGMAYTTLATGGYVQLFYGAQGGCLLEVLPGSSYSIIRIPQ